MTEMTPKPTTNIIDRVSGPNPCRIANVLGAIICRIAIHAAAIRNKRMTIQRWQLFLADQLRTFGATRDWSALSEESMGAFVIHTISTSIARPFTFSLLVNLNFNFSLKRKAINCASCSSRAATTICRLMPSRCMDKSPSGTWRIPT